MKSVWEHLRPFVRYAPNFGVRLCLLATPLFYSCTDEDGAISPDNFTQWENLTTDDGLISDAVFTVFTDSNANIWIGTDEGIVQYTGTEFIRYPDFNNLI